MGPLIPLGEISAEFHYIIALLIGVGFGYVLEKGGLGNTKRLMGMFYGYDMVVIRLMFAAVITASIGLVFFNYFGWIDLELLYVNPTFLWSVLVGSAIMGVGFIVGGYCPGTSMCAVGAGRIDAMVFVLGIVLGAFLFGEAYPLFKGLYTGADMGKLLIHETLGMSRGVFLLIEIIVALILFWSTIGILNKFSHRRPDFEA